MKPPKRNKRQFGLKDTPLDTRDFQLGAILDLPALEEVPDHFVVADLFVKDQKDSDFCSAYMSCLMSEVQEAVELEPSWSFAKSKELSGDVDDWGQDLRTALKTHRIGALPTTLSPHSIEKDAPTFLRQIKNWPKLEDKAYPYRKKSFFKVTGPYDHFDNARAAMWKLKNAIGSGVLWGWPMNKPYIKEIPQTGNGHAVTYIGSTFMDDGEPVLILQNSYGERVGDKGKFYVTREVYNYFVNKYGHYMFMDISPEEAKECFENGYKIGDSYLAKLLKRLLQYV